MNNRELIIGFDLGNEYSQLSYAIGLSNEPTSISLDKIGEGFLIPTAIGFSIEERQWVYGIKAINMAKENKAHLVSNILDKVRQSKTVKIIDSVYESTYLLERYIYKILIELKGKWPGKTIRQMVITIDKPDPLIVSSLYKVLDNLGLRDRVSVISYSWSYLAYVLSQEKDIWTNDVALFDFSKEGFKYMQMSLERRKLPHLVQIKEKDYNDLIYYNELDKIKSNGNFEYVLDNIFNDALYKQIVSAIYFTGQGFVDGIPMTTINKISKGRRLFIGQNLYCKGACLYGVHLAGEESLGNYIFLVDDTIHYSVKLTVNDQDIDKSLYLVKLGSSIYEKPNKIGLILDGERKVKYQVRNKKGMLILEDILELEGLPQRPSKTSRIEVSLKVISKSRFIIQIVDKGFGEMYSGTDKIWEKEVSISG
jgi:hypothetical protein